MAERTILLVAGGTGGHLFPALALGEVLARRGFEVHFATDERVGRLIEGVPPESAHTIRSATIAGGNPATLARSLASLGAGLGEARRLLGRLRPAAVVGFGGYPSVPPLVAARLARVPAIVHEQNAVLGRANRLLVRLGAHLATGFRDPKGGTARATHVGNPVRAAIREAARSAYAPPRPGGLFRLLVFGGSQGARVFSDLLPQALVRLPKPLRACVVLSQQCRPEDMERTGALYESLGVPAELAAFFPDMAERLRSAHLVISRAGASTVSELAAVGRPAILVPYPHALDHDQAANAAALAREGGAWIFREADLTPEILGQRLFDLMENPESLARAAEAARAAGELDAAERLADLVQRLSGESAGAA